jgi:hypothetical protein
MTENPDPSVEYIVLNGNTETEEDLDAVVDIIRHSLRTQFACKKVTVSIQIAYDEYFEGTGIDSLH